MKKARKNSSIKPLYAFVLALFLALFIVPGNTYAQEGTSLKNNNKSAKLNKKANRGKKKFDGDTPKSNKRQKRTLRFKTRNRQGEMPHIGDITGRKVKTKVSPRPASPANRAVPNPYAGKPRKTEASAARMAASRAVPRPYTATQKGERAFTGSISGRRLRTKNTSSARMKVYRPKPIYAGKPGPSESDKAKKAAKYAKGGGKVSERSISNNTKKVVRKPNPYAGRKVETEADRARKASRNIVWNKSFSAQRKQTPGVSTPRSISAISRRFTNANRGRLNPATRSISGRNRQPVGAPDIYTGLPRRRTGTGSGKGFGKTVRSASGQPKFSGGQPGKPRSASVSGIPGKPKSPYGGGYGRKMQPWERGHKGDLTGRKLRRKGFSTIRPGIKSITSPYYGRAKSGEKAYSGRIQSNFNTASRPSELAGGSKRKPGIRSISKPSESPPVSNRNVAARRTLFGQFSAPLKADNPYFGRGKKGDKPYLGNVKPNNRTISKPSESRPGAGQNFAGNRSVTAQFKGPGKAGFSPYMGRKKGGEIAYAGNVKPRNNSITRSSENNPGSNKNIAGNRSVTAQFKGAGRPGFNPYWGRKRRGDQAYAGNVKPRNNSITRSSENNPGSNKNIARARSVSGQFKGEVKTAFDPYYGKGIKGGERGYKGKMQPQNKSASGENYPHNEPLPKMVRTKNGAMAATFSGLTKASKPKKGGGSVSRNSWNNEAQPITVKSRTRDAARASAFSGLARAQKPLKGGGSISGQGWNNDATPLQRKKQSPQQYYAMKFQGDTKEKHLIPEKNMEHKDFTGNYRTKNLVPEKNTEYRNYSGTIKVVRKKGMGYHPSFYFYREKENSQDEKGKKLSVKLLIGKIFRTNQPVNLREKKEKPGFDKREEGLWFE